MLSCSVHRQISTHSLTRRLTSLPGYNHIGTPYFNSQPHKEADIHFVKEKDTTIFISTHSLTRRLTTIVFINNNWLCISTHSLTRRLTHYHLPRYFLMVFQLTASQGG